ncbi:glycosyltransferase [Rubrivirga sp. S365]|uniref:Glycosyltransferase n=1 Tax=Rubrivirga litoralis TaxID=3075598 RepID=A0ABU3BR94_9BACT|nr:MULTISPECIES: glycosyltransferase [unclassified Rubrivirga]MDT0631812.1 glycosyltransferase [Rubrivirga sp. F394]MDT7856496.1 glycosyltransferase [Rubrivirga sp. S365]
MSELPFLGGEGELPLVSVVIPSYNHEAYVARSIQSVLDQTYPHIELVVVDDGSTDGSWEEVQRVQEATNRRFEAFQKGNGGVSSTLNYGIARTRGSLVAVLASDDYFLPSKIEKQVTALAALGPDYGLIHTSAYNDHMDGRLIDITGLYPAAKGAQFFELVSLQVTAVAPSVLFKREVYEEVGGFDESLVAEDLDFYAAIAFHGHKLHYIPEPLVVKTYTGSNLGLNVEGNFEAHLRTVHKYESHLDAEEYSVALANVYLSKGRSAAGSGRRLLALGAYREAARLQKSPRPYAEWVTRSARSLTLGLLPASLRSWLRGLRAVRSQPLL